MPGRFPVPPGLGRFDFFNNSSNQRMQQEYLQLARQQMAQRERAAQQKLIADAREAQEKERVRLSNVGDAELDAILGEEIAPGIARWSMPNKVSPYEFGKAYERGDMNEEYITDKAGRMTLARGPYKFQETDEAYDIRKQAELKRKEEAEKIKQAQLTRRYPDVGELTSLRPYYRSLLSLKQLIQSKGTVEELLDKSADMLAYGDPRFAEEIKMIARSINEYTQRQRAGKEETPEGEKERNTVLDRIQSEIERVGGTTGENAKPGLIQQQERVEAIRRAGGAPAPSFMRQVPQPETGGPPPLEEMINTSPADTGQLKEAVRQIYTVSRMEGKTLADGRRAFDELRYNWNMSHPDPESQIPPGEYPAWLR